jgi:broad specificity phosphatase PhoE
LVTVHLMRHGQVHNPDGVLYGRLPGFRLSELGRRQARAGADWFAGRPIAYLVCSPLERARQTAAPIAEATGTQLTIDDRLIEAGSKLEGRRSASGKHLLGDLANWRYFGNPLRPSWGEPYRQIADRVLAAAHDARDAAAAAGTDGAEALCVSHQLPIVAARRAAEGRWLFHDPRRRKCALASVTSFSFAGETIVPVDYAEPAAELATGHGAGG